MTTPMYIYETNIVHGCNYSLDWNTFIHVVVCLIHCCCKAHHSGDEQWNKEKSLAKNFTICYLALVHSLLPYVVMQQESSLSKVLWTERILW